MGTLTEGFSTGRSSAKYITISSGKFVRTVPEGTPGAVKRIKESGKEVFEIKESDFTGRLISAKVKEHESYGKQLILKMKSKGDIYSISMKFDSGYSKSFLATIPNAELEGLMLLSPIYEEKDGFKNTSILIQTDAGWLKRFYTKENLPETKKVVFKGKTETDNTDLLEFFEQLVSKLNAKLESIYGKDETEDVAEEVAETADAASQSENLGTPFGQPVKAPF